MSSQEGITSTPVIWAMVSGGSHMFRVLPLDIRVVLWGFLLSTTLLYRASFSGSKVIALSIVPSVIHHQLSI